MTDYTGLKCPVCEKPFASGDDIVVCPECGAPYHRECYAKVGRCVFSDKHGTPDAWSPPKPEATGEEATENKSQRCPRCGSPNSQSAMFCEHCGQPLTINQQDFPGFPQNGSIPPNGSLPQNGGFPKNGPPFPQGQPVPFIFDPLGGVNPNEPIDDVPAGDIAKLIQNNTQYYLPAFVNLKKFSTNRFNFSAFLFSGGWLLYRKQYKIGSIIAAIITTLYLISTYVSVSFSEPLLASLLKQVGASSDTLSPTYTQMIQVSELLIQQPALQIFLFFVPTMILVIEFVIMLIVGFNGNKWYLTHCVNKVNQIHQTAPESVSAAIQLQEQGGVNAPLAICLLVCYMIVTYMPRF